MYKTHKCTCLAFSVLSVPWLPYSLVKHTRFRLVPDLQLRSKCLPFSDRHTLKFRHRWYETRDWRLVGLMISWYFHHLCEHHLPFLSLLCWFKMSTILAAWLWTWKLFQWGASHETLQLPLIIGSLVLSAPGNYTFSSVQLNQAQSQNRLSS